MTRVNKCNGCGKIVDDVAFDFQIDFLARKNDGGGVLPDGLTNVEWNHMEDYGDLCSECSEDIIEQINEVLK